MGMRPTIERESCGRGKKQPGYFSSFHEEKSLDFHSGFGYCGGKGREKAFTTKEEVMK